MPNRMTIATVSTCLAGVLIALAVVAMPGRADDVSPQHNGERRNPKTAPLRIFFSGFGEGL